MVFFSQVPVKTMISENWHILIFFLKIEVGTTSVELGSRIVISSHIAKCALLREKTVRTNWLRIFDSLTDLWPTKNLLRKSRLQTVSISGFQFTFRFSKHSSFLYGYGPIIVNSSKKLADLYSAKPGERVISQLSDYVSGFFRPTLTQKQNQKMMEEDMKPPKSNAPHKLLSGGLVTLFGCVIVLAVTQGALWYKQGEDKDDLKK